MDRDRIELYKFAKLDYSKVKARLEEIISLLTGRELSCPELAKILSVSERTIKRDVRYLRSMGYRIVVRGYRVKKYLLLK